MGIHGRSVLLTLLFAFALFSIATPALCEGQGETEHLRARVISIQDMPGADGVGGTYQGKLVRVEVTSPPFRGEVIQIEHIHAESVLYGFALHPGDDVVLYAEIKDGSIEWAHIDMLARDGTLRSAAIVLFILMVAIGGIRGAKALLSLGLVGLAITKVLIPMVLRGLDPVVVSVVVGVVVSTICFLIIGGLGRKSLVATIGTAGGVVGAGVFAFVIGRAARLTGIGGEEAVMLMYIPQGTDFDFRGILFAGMILGALGAVMDIGMSIASAMEEIRSLNPSANPISLFRSGMSVGKDIMGTMSNTLILAYTGASLPLLLLFAAYDTPLVRIVNVEFMATEIVRAIAGSAGLVLAIPITAMAGARVLTPRGNDGAKSG